MELKSDLLSLAEPLEAVLLVRVTEYTAHEPQGGGSKKCDLRNVISRSRIMGGGPGFRNYRYWWETHESEKPDRF